MAVNKGQEKLHRVAQVDANGQIIPGTDVNMDGTPRTMSQADWRNRDKTSNLVRLNEDGTVDTGDTGTTDTGTTDTGSEGGTPSA